jgi:phage replication-related protein YjqB (UPF0714/DUF867 family)
MAHESSRPFAEPYYDFKELFQHEVRGRDYEILTRKRDSRFLIMAPHGGYIEFNTSEIAYYLAGEDYSYYSFLAIKDRGNTRMHVSSNRYNEPIANAMAHDADTVVTIHGMVRDPGREWTVVGGSDWELRHKIVSAFNAAGIDAEDAKGYPTLGGTRPTNICNQGQKGMGVQIELSTDLRKRCMNDIHKLAQLKNALDSALQT